MIKVVAVTEAYLLNGVENFLSPSAKTRILHYEPGLSDRLTPSIRIRSLNLSQPTPFIHQTSMFYAHQRPYLGP